MELLKETLIAIGSSIIFGIVTPVVIYTIIDCDFMKDVFKEVIYIDDDYVPRIGALLVLIGIISIVTGLII